MAKYKNILETVGNTPVVRIQRLAPAGVNVFVKVEAFNPLGSVKDRLALGVIEAAEASGESGGGGVLGLLARPPWEAPELSAATTRWLVRRELSTGERSNPRWSAELLRCKGVQPTPGAHHAWVLESDRESGAVVVPPEVVDRPGQTPPAVGAERGGGGRRIA